MPEPNMTRPLRWVSRNFWALVGLTFFAVIVVAGPIACVHQMQHPNETPDEYSDHPSN